MGVNLVFKFQRNKQPDTVNRFYFVGIVLHDRLCVIKELFAQEQRILPGFQTIVLVHGPYSDTASYIMTAKGAHMNERMRVEERFQFARKSYSGHREHPTGDGFTVYQDVGNN